MVEWRVGGLVNPPLESAAFGLRASGGAFSSLGHACVIEVAPSSDARSP